MIDEKKLIEAINEIHYYIAGLRNGKSILFKYMNRFKDDVIRTIELQPKVGEWIPVEVELPKYNDEYNVTVGVASEFGYFEKVTTLRYEIILGKEPKWVIPVDKVYRVIAWMPLPELYNAERGGNNE